MPVLIARGLVLNFRQRRIFDSISFQLNKGDKASLVGVNGSGKTTLLNAIAGIQPLDEGEVSFSKGATYSYLPQEISCAGDSRTLEDALMGISFSGNLEVYEKQKAITLLLNGFGFAKSDRKRRCDEFSLGWQMRIALVKALAASGDFIFLDEPTNYLDIECRMFLCEYLRKCASGYLLVSHDKHFLNSTCTITYELLAGDLIRYPGNYSFYEKRKAEICEGLEREREKRDSQKAQIMAFVERFRSKPTKARQVQERIKRLERIEDLEVFQASKAIRFSFHALADSPPVLIECDDVRLSYDGKRDVIKGFGFTLCKGDRVAIIGGNGMGKTTLLRLFSKDLMPSGGSVFVSGKARCGYYAQDSFQSLDGEKSVFDEVAGAACLPAEKVQSMLGAFLFSGDDVLKSVGVLSGGEKARVAICKMLLSPLNLLLLDEITNHLDIMSKDVLKRALLDFPGSMAFVSHDLDFIRDIANKIIYFDRNGHHIFLGDYSYFAYKMKGAPFGEVGLGAFLSGQADASLVPDALVGQGRIGEAKVTSAKKAHDEARKKRNERNALLRRRQDLEREESEIKALITLKGRCLENPEIYGDVIKAKQCADNIEALKVRLKSVEDEYWQVLQAIGF